MRKKSLLTFALIVITIFSILNCLPAHSEDIKNKVIKETDIEDQIQEFCNEYCQGNKRKGYLKSLTMNQIADTKYNVVARVALRSKHVYKDVIIYNHTVLVNTFGTLNSENCELEVNEMYVQNDFRDIFTQLLKENTDVIGRKEIIQDCRKFLDI